MEPQQPIASAADPARTAPPAGPSSPRRRGRRRLAEGPALDRARLAQVLVAIARAEGLGAISMRRVAADLGVSSRLLYHHVRDKDEMLDILSDAITARNMPDLSGADWETRLRNVVAAARGAFADFPGVPASILGHVARPVSQPHALMVRNGVLRALADAGLSPEHVEISYVQFAVMLLGSLVMFETLDRSQGPLAIDRARLERSVDLGFDLLIFGIRRLIPGDFRPA
jgi:AcrR family transcriptional regulator